jgi:hypothetical protein
MMLSPLTLVRQDPSPHRQRRIRRSPPRSKWYVHAHTLLFLSYPTVFVLVSPYTFLQPQPEAGLSPQVHLDSLLRSRGYSSKSYKTIQSAYYNTPTALQQASYHTYLLDLVRAKDIKTFESLLSSGISPNPCNIFGESLVHMLCRRGDAALLSVLVKHHGSFQVADDQGRTPLHDACWTATMQPAVVDLILQQDVRLFHMMDSRGALPLSYVCKEQESAWIQYIESRKDVYWPMRAHDDDEEEPPPLVLLDAKSRPIPDPSPALTVELAVLVTSGWLKPSEALLLAHQVKDGNTTEDAMTVATDVHDDDDDFSDDDGDDEDCYDGDGGSFCSLSTFDEEEMADILSNLSALRQVAGNNNKVIPWSR